MDRRDFLNLTGSGAFSVTATRLFSPQNDRWEPDGIGALARIGVLTPHFDPVPESEMTAMAPRGVSIHSARVSVKRGDPKAFADPQNVDIAVEQLRELAPRVIVYGYTSSSYVLGLNGDAALKARLQQRARGTPVVLPCDAAVEALRLLSVKRVALIHPPWFSEATNEAGRIYFRTAGFDPVLCARIAPLRSLQEEVAPAEVHEWVMGNVPREAQAVMIGGNGLRAVGVIRALEEALRRPVLTANQVAFWKALQLVGVADRVTKYGIIFSNRGGKPVSWVRVG